MGFKSLLTTTHAHRVLATALLTLLLAAVGTTAQAQRVGLKTNLLYWATATPNVGLEFQRTSPGRPLHGHYRHCRQLQHSS